MNKRGFLGIISIVVIVIVFIFGVYFGYKYLGGGENRRGK